MDVIYAVEIAVAVEYLRAEMKLETSIITIGIADTGITDTGINDTGIIGTQILDTQIIGTDIIGIIVIINKLNTFGFSVKSHDKIKVMPPSCKICRNFITIFLCFGI